MEYFIEKCSDLENRYIITDSNDFDVLGEHYSLEDAQKELTYLIINDLDEVREERRELEDKIIFVKNFGSEEEYNSLIIRLEYLNEKINFYTNF